MKAFVAQTRLELALTARRGESVLVTIGIPVLLLSFFAKVHVLDTGVPDPVAFLVPGILALAVMSTAMVALGIATGFERSTGVLKRLGSTPLTRPALVGAKFASVLAIEAVQVLVVVGVGYALGWHRAGSFVSATGALALGTAAFAGLGLLMAGRLRAEVNLAAANGLYIVLLLLGGIVFPLTRLPAGLRDIAQALPAAALARAVRGALSAGGVPGDALAVLGVWAAAALGLAAAGFRWE
jgi:ABC-2 type transport system permease protein